MCSHSVDLCLQTWWGGAGGGGARRRGRRGSWHTLCCSRDGCTTAANLAVNNFAFHPLRGVVCRRWNSCVFGYFLERERWCLECGVDGDPKSFQTVWVLLWLPLDRRWLEQRCLVLLWPPWDPSPLAVLTSCLLLNLVCVCAVSLLLIYMLFLPSGYSWRFWMTVQIKMKFNSSKMEHGAQWNQRRSPSKSPLHQFRKLSVSLLS